MITELGRLLRIIRVNSGDSTHEMAKKLHISTSLLIAIENGRRKTPEDIEERLCSVYNLLESDKKKIRDAIASGEEKQTKPNLTDFGKKKKNAKGNESEDINALDHTESRGRI